VYISSEEVNVASIFRFNIYWARTRMCCNVWGHIQDNMKGKIS